VEELVEEELVEDPSVPEPVKTVDPGPMLNFGL
jgi:hypothetical protein